MAEPTVDGWYDRYDSEEAIRAVAQGLLDTSWPEPDWKHREHCVATLGLILFYPEMNLDVELPGIIQRYNSAHGGQNTDTAGYHHTMTLLYLNAIRHFVKTLPAGTSGPEACRALLASPIGKKRLSIALLFARENHVQRSPPRLGRSRYGQTCISLNAGISFNRCLPIVEMRRTRHESIPRANTPAENCPTFHLFPGPGLPRAVQAANGSPGRCS